LAQIRRNKSYKNPSLVVAFQPNNVEFSTKAAFFRSFVMCFGEKSGLAVLVVAKRYEN